MATGDSQFGQCDVDSWKDIVAISAAGGFTAGLKSDGTVLVTDGEEGTIDVSSWKDVVSISLGYWHIAGLKSDGTVLASGFDNNVQCSVDSFDDIVSIGIGADGIGTVGVKSDGTLVSALKKKIK